MTDKDRIRLFKQVFEDNDGAKVLEALIEYSGFRARDGICDNDRMLCFQQGKRAVVGYIIETINSKVQNGRKQSESLAGF